MPVRKGTTMRLIRILRIGVGTTLLLLLLSIQLVSAQNENEIRGAWQPFTGGVMVWVESTDLIFVLINEGYDNGRPFGRYIVADNTFEGDAHPAPHRENGCWESRRGFRKLLNDRPNL